MSDWVSPLLDLRSLPLPTIETVFSQAREISHAKPGQAWKRRAEFQGQTLALLFFEPSTRTRMSFETAAHRVGLSPLLLDGGIKSSLEKGESVEDSILNVAAMNPLVLVIRCGDLVDLQALAKQVRPRILNAGWGMKGHPSQALLDAFTIQQRRQTVQKQKVLFVGDVKHSRVAASHFELLPRLGAEIAVCAPNHFLPENFQHLRIPELDQALAWADVVIALRCQFERHAGGHPEATALQDYRENYGLNVTRLRRLNPKAIVMHPGPINHGIELETEVLQDSRCCVLQQVTNGVFVRESLLRASLEGAF